MRGSIAKLPRMNPPKHEPEVSALLKRLLPTFCVLLSVLLDTAVIPAFYYGCYIVPVSLVIVILIGIQLGRVRGMLFGMIAGLLLDISSGTLGLKLFPYIAIGFLVGLLLDQQPQLTEAKSGKERFQLLAVRAIWIAILVLIYELVMVILQYFNNAVFQWVYVRDLLIRTCIVTLLSLLLYNPVSALLIGKSTADRNRKTREVKHF